jgi:hypothetical protein
MINQGVQVRKGLMREDLKESEIDNY